MSDVSVLLNLTSRIAFEETDPLMSLVNAKEPLLFYDRLSVEKFPSDKELYLEHSERLVSNLRNLLEARSLSVDDDDGRIRLIIILDLVEGIFQPDGNRLFFPAQKVRAVRALIARIFEERNPLLDRMEYDFIFINSSADDRQLSSFYQQLAYDGCTGLDDRNWFSGNVIRLNERRDELFRQLDAPDVDMGLDDPGIHPVYLQFGDAVAELMQNVGSRLAEAGVRDEFELLMRDALSKIRTVGDFETYDYDAAVRACVSKLIGLKANDFFTDCVFFILRYDESPAAIKQRDEVFVKSLVQLLSTVNSDDYTRYFKSTVLRSARLFVLTEYANSNINVEALSDLGRQARVCLPRLSDAKWTEDMDVEYRVFSPNITEPSKSDTHRELNEKYIRTRTRKVDDFIDARQIPFFFDKKKGGWDWYSEVMECATDLYEYEKENDRPLYDTPKRITGKEMRSETKKTTYRELENDRLKLSKQDVQVMHVEDLNAYMTTRRGLMDSLARSIDALRGELPKLGYLACLFWLGAFSVLGFTLCYSLHFWNDNAGPLYAIAIAFGAAGLLFMLSSLIAQVTVKRKIRRVYDEMDSTCRQMRENLEKYLADVNKRSRLQKEADVRRRNLDEMEEKLAEFKSHNKRVDLWKTHFASIAEKLDYTLAALGKDEEPASDQLKLNVSDFSLDGFPTMPLTVRSKYRAMNTQIMQVPVEITSVTCFVKHFRFTEINPI